jgi:ATP-dependent Clp protease ATP-binding subunit ClpC
MFERYNEKARRVIFFARSEASDFGSRYIEPEHMLLGLLRVDEGLTKRFLHALTSIESVREQMDGHAPSRERIATSVDLDFSGEGKRVLAHAAEEAGLLGDNHIGTEHLLLSILREEKCFVAEWLKESGVKFDAVRSELIQRFQELQREANRVLQVPILRPVKPPKSKS